MTTYQLCSFFSNSIAEIILSLRPTIVFAKIHFGPWGMTWSGMVIIEVISSERIFLSSIRFNA